MRFYFSIYYVKDDVSISRDNNQTDLKFRYLLQFALMHGIRIESVKIVIYF